MSCVSAMYRRLLGDMVSDAREWEARFGVVEGAAPVAPARRGGVPGGVVDSIQNGSVPTHVRNVGGLTTRQRSYPFQIRDLAFQPLDDALSFGHAHEPDGKTALARLSHVLGAGCIAEQPGEIDGLEGVNFGRTWFGVAGRG